MFGADVEFNPDSLQVLPSVVLTAGRCENPECREIHGYQLFIGWLLWGIVFTWASGQDY